MAGKIIKYKNKQCFGAVCLLTKNLELMKQMTNRLLAIWIGIAILFFMEFSYSYSFKEEVIEAIPKQHQINYDYEIDLRPNFIVVYSKNGNIDTIPHGKLEYFFQRDNE